MQPNNIAMIRFVSNIIAIAHNLAILYHNSFSILYSRFRSSHFYDTVHLLMNIFIGPLNL